MILNLMDNNPLEGERKNIGIRIKKIQIFFKNLRLGKKVHTCKKDINLCTVGIEIICCFNFWRVINISKRRVVHY